MAGRDLILDNVVAGYGGTTIIDGVTLQVREGECVGIIGRNGAGKTTTLATAMGLTQLRSGRISFTAQDLTSHEPWRRARAGIGYVPQSRDIFASLSVEDNLIAGLHGADKGQLGEAWSLFPRLQERRKNFGNQLSGGEQQMLSIARALMGRPAILLLDEPLEGLSPIVAHEVMGAVRTLARTRGLGCVLVEQQVSLVLDFASQVLVLERGRSVYWGDTPTLRTRAEILESAVGLRKVLPDPHAVS